MYSFSTGTIFQERLSVTAFRVLKRKSKKPKSGTSGSNVCLMGLSRSALAGVFRHFSVFFSLGDGDWNDLKTEFGTGVVGKDQRSED